jgi:hypothetical protein
MITHDNSGRHHPLKVSLSPNLRVKGERRGKKEIGEGEGKE